MIDWSYFDGLSADEENGVYFLTATDVAYIFKDAMPAGVDVEDPEFWSYWILQLNKAVPAGELTSFAGTKDEFSEEYFRFSLPEKKFVGTNGLVVTID